MKFWFEGNCRSEIYFWDRRWSLEWSSYCVQGYVHSIVVYYLRSGGGCPYCGGSLLDLNFTMGGTLKMLKHDGVISSPRSSVGAFKQSAQTASQAFEITRNADGKPLHTDKWNPPAWKLFQKFCCLGSGVCVSAGHSFESRPIRAKRVCEVAFENRYDQNETSCKRGIENLQSGQSLGRFEYQCCGRTSL